MTYSNYFNGSYYDWPQLHNHPECLEESNQVTKTLLKQNKSIRKFISEIISTVILINKLYNRKLLSIHFNGLLVSLFLSSKICQPRRPALDPEMQLNVNEKDFRNKINAVLLMSFLISLEMHINFCYQRKTVINN